MPIADKLVRANPQVTMHLPDPLAQLGTPVVWQPRSAARPGR
jgi:hypothetical protein